MIKFGDKFFDSSLSNFCKKILEKLFGKLIEKKNLKYDFIFR